MRRYLVVANQTLGGDHLVQEVRERMIREPSEFWVLVPATQPSHHGAAGFGMGYASGGGVNPYGLLAGAEPDAMTNSGAALARQRLDAELRRLHDAGATADGEVGDPDPLRAIDDAIKGRRFDEIILSTLPRARSGWLRQDLPSRVEQRFKMPVTHIVSG